MSVEFKLPALAENVDTVTVTRVLVNKGDAVSKDQAVLEIETDKAATEVPVNVSGVVEDIRVQEGQKVQVGTVVLVIAPGASAPVPAPAPVEAPKPEAKPAEVEAPKPVTVEAPAPKPANVAAFQRTSPAAGGPVSAPPSVRRLARELGVDLHTVVGSGSDGRITEQDVRRHAAQREVKSTAAAPSPEQLAAKPAAPTPRAPEPAPRAVVEGIAEQNAFGQIVRQEMNSVRRRTAENLSNAWATIPHVTQFDKADTTEIESLRKRYGKVVEKSGGKLTVTAILAKVLAVALKKFPQFNSSIDVAANQIVYKQYYNIGIAVDTERGLIVPVVRDVDKKNITQIAAELNQIAERTRNRQIKLEDLQGSTFTISNLGGIGGSGFTPIVNPPEVAILGVSRSSVEPVWNGSEFKPRTMLPLSLSYDHRVIDGADAARFLRWVCEALEEPFFMFVDG
ncbi:MAG: dihydrolipoamide acetyltransferase component of pyruvate dehydrogenase complex [Candidatus Hydrogenedentota bacterium]